MPEFLPELAVEDDFSSEAYDPDEEGIYQTVKYKRNDGTLYMESKLSGLISPGMYERTTLTYYDRSGLIPLHQVIWTFQYDINKKIISKRIEWS